MLVVFDWDGTIIDSAAKIIASMQQAARSCQVDVLVDDEIKNIIGLGLPEALLQLYPDLEFIKRKQIQAAYSEAFIEADKIPCDFFHGVEDLLHDLQGRGHKIAVATGKSRKGLNRVLQRLDWQQRFDATRCADETASKPDPLMLHQLMQQMDYAAVDTLMVGDTEYDLEMASNAGVASVGVSYGAHAVERLQKHGPIAIIDSLSLLTQSLR
ncbi:MAG: HAD-IA family hydrolase [Pseudomonadales bacterium]|nr:HAD-IA family hydrolase [Pseudomonadales bacterium]